MFAVVEIGGKQFKVSKGEKITVNKLPEEEGKTIKFDTVMLLGESDDKAKIGQPYIDGATVEAKIIKHFKDDKIKVMKFTSKKRHQKTYGHRQPISEIEITSIEG